MSHPDERTIGLYAIDPRRVDAGSRAHIESCEQCAGDLRLLREFEDLLRAPESWVGVTKAPPRADPELREFAVRSADEDEEALRLLEGFEDPSAAGRFVWLDVASKPEYQTGGVARLLCKWANAMCAHDPLYALKQAEAATTISQMLPDDSYPRGTIHELRGQALKEQAYALRLLGRFPEALRAVDSAETELSNLRQESVTLALVKFVRGTILWEQENLDEAELAAADAAETASRLAAGEIQIWATNLLGYILFDRHNYAGAADIFEASLRRRHAEGAPVWIARDSLSVGLCHLELHQLSGASRHLHEALRHFVDLRMGPDVTRTHWAIARLIFAEGNPQEAIYRLRRCITEFSRLQILTDAALVAIDLAEILDATGRQREIGKVLTGVVQTFMNAGKHTSALTALAYLKDASSNGTMTGHLVSYVRHFVKRAERQPNLLFVPPPV